MNADGDQGGPKPKQSRRVLAAAAHIAAVVTAGTFTNIFSDKTVLKGLAVSALAAGSLAAASWLRDRPRAPIAKLSVRFVGVVLLTGCLVGSVVSSTAAAMITVVCAILGTASLAAQNDLPTAVRLLLRLLLVGVLAASVGSGIRMLIDGRPWAGTALLAAGVTASAAAPDVRRMLTRSTDEWQWGYSLILEMPRQMAVTIVLVGQLMLLATICAAPRTSPLAAVMPLQACLISLLGVAQMRRSEPLAVIAMAGLGLSILGAGIFFLLIAEAVLWGALGLVIGMTIIAFSSGPLHPWLLRLRQRIITLAEEPPETAQS